MKIENMPKPWWPGDPRVERYMSPVLDAIHRHASGDAATDIYNRAYEAVYHAIRDYTNPLFNRVAAPERRKGDTSE